jgi:hypothetical protein
MCPLLEQAIVVFVAWSSQKAEKGRREKMGKAMSRATGAHNLRVTMVIVALAAVLLVLTLVAVIQSAPTTSERGDANPAMSAEGKGGSRSVNNDPIERHAEVVERLGNGSLR